VEDSESETLMAILQDWVPEEQRPWEQLHKHCSFGVQVPHRVLHWLSTIGCTFAEISFLGSLKNASWDWSKFRSGICLFLWREGLLAICAFRHAHFEPILKVLS
jgi:hypothetical protein